MAGYNFNETLTLDLFTRGLPHALITKVIEFDEPTTYEQWRRAVIKRQEQYVHLKARLNNFRPQTITTRNPGRGSWMPPAFQRDPNAMDTSAGRTRGRVAGLEDMTETELNKNAQFASNNPFRQGYQRRTIPPPGGWGRGGFSRGGFGRGGGQRQDPREVICYQCNQKGHFSRNCPQQPWNQNRGGSSRQAQTEYDEENLRTAQAVADTRPPQQRATDWLRGVAGEDDETKSIILQEMWKKEDFPNA
jgi:Zinc knuckle